ncbi:MAG: hypothetical protein RL017_96 [Pseudomonadota bacterium]|jgi:ABC-type uncharacterized transport system auxiliary subunit|nr:ABC-type transport auxiliary lipoprotein family protein [Burkholderiales bacterium]
MNNKSLVLGSSLALILSLNACSILSPVPTAEVKQYQIIINQQNDNSCQANSSSPILQVAAVTVFSPYDSTNMYYSQKQYQVNSYAQSQWASSTSSMYTQLLTQKLQQSCIYSNVISSEYVASANYRLVTQLTDLKQIITKDGASMHLGFYAQLIDNKTNKVIMSKNFSEEMSVTPDIAGYINGSNVLSGKLLNDITAWLS